METTLTLPEAWQNLPFAGLYDENEERKVMQQKYALEIAQLLEQGHNVALDAPTGSGKTIMALLVWLALRRKTIFLVPKEPLAEQHQKLLGKITGSSADSCVMTGAVTPRLRAGMWREKASQLVFATPETILNDLRSDIFPRGTFKFVIVDEFHHAHNRYAYVPILKRVQAARIPILTLSANADDLAAQRNCFVTRVVKANIPMPRKILSTIIVEPTAELHKADIMCRRLTQSILDELINLGLIAQTTQRLTAIDLQTLFKQAKRITHYWPAISALSRYWLVAYLWRSLMSASYQTFLAKAKALREDHRPWVQQLIQRQEFGELANYVAATQAERLHPKVLSQADIGESLARAKQLYICFSGEKETARHLASVLAQRDLRVPVATGELTPTQFHKLRQEFEQGKFHGLVATSYLEEGISFPGVDVVIHYSRPLTQVARLQRGGRAGRGHKRGLEISILLNHWLEWSMERKTKPAERLTFTNENQLHLFREGL